MCDHTSINQISIGPIDEFGVCCRCGSVFFLPYLPKQLPEQPQPISIRPILRNKKY